MDERPAVVIDGDSHWYEPATMWKEHSASADRDLAVEIRHDDLGYPWVFLGNRALNLPAFFSEPMAGLDFTLTGKTGNRWRAGKRSTRSYEDMPDDYWLASGRLKSLDGWGIDEQVAFPQWGFQLEFRLGGHEDVIRTNLEAWNRYAVELAHDGRGRIHPVGHVRLSNGPAWVRSQLELLSKHGVRLVLMVPGLVDGKRLSHPDVDAIWQAFVDYDTVPTWHISQEMTKVFADVDAWTANDGGEGIFKMVTNPMTRTAVEISLIDMAVNGVFHRHPDLKVLTAEVGASWFPVLCRRLDHLYRINEELAGHPFNPVLDRAPGDYLRRSVQVICSFPTDATAEEMEEIRGHASFGGDFPHPEGLASPLDDYRAILGPVSDETSQRIYGGNLGRILHP
ncbi:MAG TPA: amidohydrolase family protein [Acidimicrobiales bacterium]|nr:amidohydrolase family protein [Acidimicrobiales bacterium]